MAGFSTELSGSVVFNSGSLTQAALVPSLNALALTGSFNITGSELTFNGVDVMNKIEALEAGSTGQASILPLNQHSASINEFTSSQVTINQNNMVDSASFDNRIDTLEFNYNTVDNKVTNLENQLFISSSGQISALGFITSSNSNLYSSSAQLLDAGFVTSSIADIPAGTISSSAQIQVLGYITSSEYATYAQTASYISVDNIDGIVNSSISSSYAVTASYIDPTFISASAAAAGFGEGGDIIPAGTISSSAQISNLGFITSSTGGDTTGLLTIASYQIDSASFDSRISAINISGDTGFDGDRIVSNQDLGDLYTNSFNAGTTGSIQDFLTAVFFPNTAPSFVTSANQQVVEYATSGSTLLTLSASDSEGQSVTFALASSYTAGYVTVSSTGVVKLAVIPTEIDFNTDDRGDGTLAHPVDIEVTDSFGSTTTKTFYFKVNANTAPKFRQTSTSGTVITSFTANRNENASTGLVGRIYFTDDEGDAITITSASDANGHFTLTKYSNYVQIDQVTGSLDYENIANYTMSITASDEHYPSQDANSVTTLPIVINVTDNLQPSINNQTLGSINEDSSAGTTVGTIASSDNEGDTRTFFDFNLYRLEYNNSEVTQGTYGGTNQSDPTENPFQMNSSGVVTRKSGVYLNSDLIDEYHYQVKVKDSFNTASNSAVVVIPIQDDPAPFIYNNWTGGPYIIESATTGDQIKTNSNGYSGTQARLTSNESVTWSTNSSLIQVSNGGYLTINTDISGSYSNGQTLQAGITASNSFGTTNNTLITFTVTENQAPVLTFTDLGLNSDTAISGSNIATVSITDQETDTPYTVTLSGTDADKFNLVPTNAATSSLNIQLTESLPAATYSITVTATDRFSKTGLETLDIVVDQAADLGKVYVYDLGFYDGTYNNNLGIQSVGSETIPVASSYTGFGFLEKIEDGSLGDSSFTYSWGSSRTATLLESGSDGATLGEMLQNMSTISRTNSNRFVILAPSGSDLVIPTTMTDGYGGSTVGQYVLEAATDGTALGSGLGTSEASTIHKVNLGSAHLGFNSWVMIGANNQIAGSTSLQLDVRPSSGSAPS